MKKISERQKLLMDRMGLGYSNDMSMWEASRKIAKYIERNGYPPKRINVDYVTVGDMMDFDYEEEDYDGDI